MTTNPKISPASSDITELTTSLKEVGEVLNALSTATIMLQDQLILALEDLCVTAVALEEMLSA